MKQFHKKICLAAGLLTMGGSFVSSVSSASADIINPSVIDEKWGKPTFAYGGGLSENQVNETAKLLGIDSLEDVYHFPVTGDDLANYLKEGAAQTSSMISSVLVQKQDAGEGVEVEIETPNSITEITEEQYANAAITAGVADAKIMVASVSNVTGESALTGIYKAFDENGETLDQDRMEVAQEELETTNAIAQENENTEGFDSSLLDQAIIDIKQSLQELKERQGELATKEDIERIINEALEKNKLEQIVSQEQIDRLLALFEKYQQTGAINSEQVKNQLTELSENVSDKFNELLDRAEESGWLDKIGNFFQEVWKAIVNLFKG